MKIRNYGLGSYASYLGTWTLREALASCPTASALQDGLKAADARASALEQLLAQARGAPGQIKALYRSNPMSILNMALLSRQ